MSDAEGACRLVVCDDSDALVRLLELAFEIEDGIDLVGTAADGVEVVGVCEQLRPDVLLLDVAMPRRDGIEALPHVRRASPDTTVLVYTGFASDDVRAKALDAGAFDLLLKGGTPIELADRIRHVHSRAHDGMTHGGRP